MAELELPDRLRGISVVLPVVTETESLDETVRVLHGSVDAWIEQVLIMVCDRTTAASRARCEAAVDVFGDRVQIHLQRTPFLGGALRDAFALASASHTVMMASDLETDPHLVAPMVALGEEHPQAIITASRWLPGGGFSGYGSVRVGLNWVFQRFTSLLYGRRLTDATFGYRLFPTSLLHAITWTGERHEFLLETILKPVRLGVQVVEIPTRWEPRSDGTSQNSVRTQARYIGALWQHRFTPQRAFLSAPTGDA
jgi:hypothetical protein